MAKVEVLNIDTSQATSSIKQLRQQLKELKDQIAGLEEGSAEFLEVATAAGQVKHQIDEIQQSVSGASADFGDMLSSATGALNGIIGGFTAAQGVMNLFGIESEATVEAMKKLQALMAIGQGIAHIDNDIKAFKKFANAIKTTETYQKLLNTATKNGILVQDANTKSTQLGTTAKIAGTAATRGATIATRAFSAALKGIGIGLVIAAVNLLIQGIEKLIGWLKKGTDNTVKFADKLKITQINLEEMTKQLSQQREFDTFYRSVYKSLNAIDDLNASILYFNKSFSETLQLQQLMNKEKPDLIVQELSDTFQHSADYLAELQINIDKLLGKKTDTKLLQTFYQLEFAFANLRKQAQDGPISADDLNKSTADIRKYFITLNSIIAQYQTRVKQYKIQLLDPETTSGQRAALQRQIEVNEEIIKNYGEGLGQLKGIYSNILGYAEAHNKLLLDDLNLSKQWFENANEIYKIQIDTVAKLNTNYGESEKYLEDQIKYYNTALSLTQKGSKEWENINAQVKILINNFYNRLISGETVEKIDSMKTSVKSVADEAERIGNIVSKNLNNTERWTSWSTAINALNAQLNVVGETLGRLTESSLGFSTNWNTAFADTQTAIMSFAENIAKNGETTAAKWAQSFALGAQAVGTILNTLSEEQDGNTKEGFEQQKKYQIGATVLNTAAGIVNAWVSAMSPTNSYLTLPGQIALAGTTTTALAALAGVQIAKIQKAQFGGSADVSSSGISSTLVAPTQYTQAVQNANIESKLGDNRVYVVESDINQTGQRVSVQESENIY